MNDVTVPAPSAPVATASAAPRRLTIRIVRYNPQEPGSRPRLQSYTLDEADGMTLFIALNEIRETQDASLHFDFVCRAGICGSCAMVIDGRPGLACRTLTKSLDATITLAPLPVFELIADLSVNTGKWMRAMSERLQSWLSPADGRRTTLFGVRSQRSWGRPMRSASSGRMAQLPLTSRHGST